MLDYIVYKPSTGEIVITGFCPTKQDVRAGAGMEAIILPDRLEVTTFGALKQALWDRVKDRRIEETAKGFVSVHGLIDLSDATVTVLSRLGAVGAGNAKAKLSLTLKDNTTVEITGKQAVALLAEVNEHLTRIHINSQTLRGLIFATEGLEDLLKVDTLSGWAS